MSQKRKAMVSFQTPKQTLLCLLLLALQGIADALAQQPIQTPKSDAAWQQQARRNGERFFEANTVQEMDEVLGREIAPAQLDFRAIVTATGRIKYPNSKFLGVINDYTYRAEEQMRHKQWDAAFLSLAQILKFGHALKATGSEEGLDTGERHRGIAAELFERLRQKVPAARTAIYRRQLQGFVTTDYDLLASARRYGQTEQEFETEVEFFRRNATKNNILLGPTDPPPPKRVEWMNPETYRTGSLKYILVVLAVAAGLALLVCTVVGVGMLIERTNERCATDYGYQPISPSNITITVLCMLLGTLGFALDDGSPKSPSNGPLAVAFFAAVFGLLLLRIRVKTDWRATICAALGLVLAGAFAGTVVLLVIGVVVGLLRDRRRYIED